MIKNIESDLIVKILGLCFICNIITLFMLIQVDLRKMKKEESFWLTLKDSIKEDIQENGFKVYHIVIIMVVSLTFLFMVFPTVIFYKIFKLAIKTVFKVLVYILNIRLIKSREVKSDEK